MAVNQLKAGAALNYVVLGLNTLLGLIYTPFMLRMLGQGEYGIYSLAASVIAYLSMLDLGFGNAVIRYTAKYRAEGKVDEQYSLFGMFTMLYYAIGLITLLVGIVLYSNVEAIFGEALSVVELSRTKVIILLMVINLAATFPLSIYGAIITAYEDFIFLRVVQILKTILSTGIMIALLCFGYKAIAMVVIQTAFNFIVLGLNYFYCKNRIHIEIHYKKIEKSLLLEIIVYSFWIFLNVIMERIYWSTGQFVLGAVSGTVAVSVFAVAIMLQQMYMMFSTAISGVFLPRITSMVVKEVDMKEVSDLFIRTGRIQYIIISLVISGFIVIGKQFIYYWAGDEYSDAFIITLIFFVSLLAPLIQNLGISILQARNQMKFRSILYISIALVSLALQIPLSKLYGGIGCALAIGGALVIGQGVIMNIFYQRKQNIDILGFWKEIIKMSIVPVTVTILFLCLKHIFDIDSIFYLLIFTVYFMAVYIPLAWHFVITDNERRLFSFPVLAIVSKVRRKND